MTDGERTDRSPRAVGVVTAGAALFCAALAGLAFQVRAGEDPAIGAGQPAQPAAERPVIARRVIIRRLVEEPATAAGTPGSSAAPVASGSSAPAAASAPAPAAAPAPAPAPAPPPAPAPVTQAS